MQKGISHSSTIYYSLLYYSIVFLSLGIVLYSYPFLKYPYDMMQHLMAIDEFYHAMLSPKLDVYGIWVNNIYTIIYKEEIPPLVPNHEGAWYYYWAKVFHFLEIESSQLFLRAKIIHIVQVYISIFSLYYFSKVIIRNIFKDIDKIHLKYLAFWSVLIWISIFATFSVVYHQVWLMWYSVNYQITLPLFWYMLALTLVLFLEQNSWTKKIFFIVQILFLSKLILQVHSMEFMYYLMHMLIFAMVFLDKVYFIFKHYFYLAVPIILIILYFIKYYLHDNSNIFLYLNFEKFPYLYDAILKEGNKLIQGYNRASASINELMYLILCISMVFIFYLLKNKNQSNTIDFSINLRIVWFIGLTSLFVLIPLYQFSGGLFAVITKVVVVNRIYYASSLFIILPIVIYYIRQQYKVKFIYINIIILSLLISTTLYSKHTEIFSHNFYKNIDSIKRSFFESKVGFNLDISEVKKINKILIEYEKAYQNKKEICYYTRPDIAFIIKYLYHKEVYWEGRHANPNYKEVYNKAKNNQVYKHILFKIPKSFPSYEPYR